MVLEQQLLALQLPLSLATYYQNGNISNIVEVITVAVNFARAAQGSAQILVDSDFKESDENDSTLNNLKKDVGTLLGGLVLFNESLTAHFCKINSKIVKVVVIASKKK